MKELNELIHRALTDRGEIARQVVIATLDSVPLKLTDYFTSRVSGKLHELFPDDVYLSAASNTLKVYQRRRAPANKYSEGAFEHQMTLIRVGCRNLAVRARVSIDTALAERLLRDKASVPIESVTPPEIRPSLLTRMSGIFISYRREDSADAAGRLYDRLSTYFGREHVFMDIDAIELGVDFVELINEKVASCDVLIAVIGRNWLMSWTTKGVVDWITRKISCAWRLPLR